MLIEDHNLLQLFQLEVLLPVRCLRPLEKTVLLAQQEKIIEQELLQAGLPLRCRRGWLPVLLAPRVPPVPLVPHSQVAS